MAIQANDYNKPIMDAVDMLAGMGMQRKQWQRQDQIRREDQRRQDEQYQRGIEREDTQARKSALWQLAQNPQMNEATREKFGNRALQEIGIDSPYDVRPDQDILIDDALIRQYPQIPQLRNMRGMSISPDIFNKRLEYADKQALDQSKHKEDIRYHDIMGEYYGKLGDAQTMKAAGAGSGKVPDYTDAMRQVDAMIQDYQSDLKRMAEDGDYRKKMEKQGWSYETAQAEIDRLRGMQNMILMMKSGMMGEITPEQLALLMGGGHGGEAPVDEKTEFQAYLENIRGKQGNGGVTQPTVPQLGDTVKIGELFPQQQSGPGLNFDINENLKRLAGM